MNWMLDLIKAVARAPENRLSAGTIADPEVRRLVHRMDELRLLDAAFEIHGARTHRYRSQPVPSAALARLEADLGTALPDQFKRWLNWVGTGAGPGHGLTCIKLGDAALPLPRALPANVIRDVSRLTPAMLGAFGAARTEHAALTLFAVASVEGLLQLCEHGCGWQSVLILAGPFKGHVVDDLAASVTPPDGAEASFAAGQGGAVGGLPLFFEWLEDWLEASIREMSQRRAGGQRS